MKHGQYAFYETKGGIRPVFLSSGSAYLEARILERVACEENDVWEKNNTVLASCARDTLTSLDILMAVDVDYEYPELDDFRGLLEGMIRRET